MKTAVIYARYSCDNQTEQSIEGQLRVCHDYAERNGILIVETYIDRAMTGTNDMRPDFQRMMKDSGKRQWNYVLVYKLDRFSRNKYEATVKAHQKKPNPNFRSRLLLIIRRNGTACEARTGSVSPLGDTQAKLVTNSLARRRAREFSRSEIPVSQMFDIFG